MLVLQLLLQSKPALTQKLAYCKGNLQLKHHKKRHISIKTSRVEGCLQLYGKCFSKEFLDFELACDLCIAVVFIESIEHIH